MKKSIKNLIIAVLMFAFAVTAFVVGGRMLSYKGQTKSVGNGTYVTHNDNYSASYLSQYSRFGADFYTTMSENMSDLINNTYVINKNINQLSEYTSSAVNNTFLINENLRINNENLANQIQETVHGFGWVLLFIGGLFVYLSAKCFAQIERDGDTARLLAKLDDIQKLLSGKNGNVQNTPQLVITKTAEEYRQEQKQKEEGLRIIEEARKKAREAQQKAEKERREKLLGNLEKTVNAYQNEIQNQVNSRRTLQSKWAAQDCDELKRAEIESKINEIDEKINILQEEIEKMRSSTI